MQSATQTASVPKKGLWAGRIITALTVLFLLFDSSLKVMRLAPAVQATTQLGYPAKLVLAIGITEFVCVLLYTISRTSILGAILLTGYLGGATATQVRLENPWFLFPAVLGVLIWVGLFWREDRLRLLLPLRTFTTGTVTE